MKTISRPVVTFLIAMTMFGASNGQSPSAILSEIYKKYDSTRFLSFDVKYRFQTDTIAGAFISDVLEGSYTMAGAKARYRLGNVEFLQNDSFLITVYHDNQVIMVTTPRNANTGSELPLRGMIDSLFSAYSRYYTITDSLSFGKGFISLYRIDSLAQYDRFALQYDSASKFLEMMQYDYTEQYLTNPDDTTGSPAKYVPQKKSLQIAFSNYRVDNFDPALYSIHQYIWKDDQEWKAISKYRDYKVYYSRTELH